MAVVTFVNKLFTLFYRSIEFVNSLYCFLAFRSYRRNAFHAVNI